MGVELEEKKQKREGRGNPRGGAWLLQVGMEAGKRHQMAQEPRPQPGPEWTNPTPARNCIGGREWQGGQSLELGENVTVRPPCRSFVHSYVSGRVGH
jgi:hypothetical protein